VGNTVSMPLLLRFCLGGLLLAASVEAQASDAGKPIILVSSRDQFRTAINEEAPHIVINQHMDLSDLADGIAVKSGTLSIQVRAQSAQFAGMLFCCAVWVAAPAAMASSAL
jgi:hypothetical protein